MVIYPKQSGVSAFRAYEYAGKTSDCVLLIPTINEGERIKNELRRASAAGIANCVDIVLLDGGSSDGSTEHGLLRSLGVNTQLVQTSEGRQSAALRMGFWWALNRGYEGILTIDGNDKDSIEDTPRLVEKFHEGYDFVQGSRFAKGAVAKNTPLLRSFAIRCIHAPLISLAAGFPYTDTTNGFRCHSRAYLSDERVKPLRDEFMGYELFCYLSTRAPQLGYKVCEVPVTRSYPKGEPAPTKIKPFVGEFRLMCNLIKNVLGAYNPKS